jgi:predicted SprT family Zn-dependent metalloprotease
MIGRRQLPPDAFTTVSQIDDRDLRAHLEHYRSVLNLEDERLWVTINRRALEVAIKRRLSAAIGGAYVFDRKRKTHLILVNLERIDRFRPRSVELVVVEELVHMRDWIDGDRRRHAKHGYDRIALRVATLTGASLDEIRSCLIPVKPRAARYVYSCPGCQRTILRKRKGTWSCGRCAPRFDPNFVFQLERDLLTETMSAEPDDPNRQERLPAPMPRSEA